METNLPVVRKAPDGRPSVVIDFTGRKRIEKYLARDVKEFHDNPKRCVIPEYDTCQSEPMVKFCDPYGYKTLWGAMLSAITGWHWLKRYFYPGYRANSEGIRLIAEHGCPHRAYASLCR